MQSKVCILTAGRGTRMAEYSAVTNKALLPLNGKATISHIIEKFSVDTEFVVAVGYFADHVKTYLKFAHPENKITIVDVDNFDGPGSGPGYSIKSCKPFLLGHSFYLVTCDTLWTDDLRKFPVSESWLSVGPIKQEESPSYCNVIVENEKIKEIRDKVFVNADKNYAWTGLAHIADGDLFWSSLDEKSTKEGANEKQVVDGFYKIAESGKMKSVEILWTDVGTYQKYIDEVKKYDIYDFSKPDEFIYIVNSRVIKFFSDSRISLMRVKKSELNTSLFPKIIENSNNFYCYEYVQGETLYIQNKPHVYKKLFEVLSQQFWKPCSVDQHEFQNMCRTFYLDKSKKRIESYMNSHDEPARINGKLIPKAKELLEALDLDLLLAGKSYFIHGDLQPDNILYNAQEDKITLIDWRHEFSGSYQVGDLYYDFAKLLAGIQLDYDQVKKGNFSVVENTENCEISFKRISGYEDLLRLLKDQAIAIGCSFDKIELLAGLVYLNMSPLHRGPFNKLLNCLGRSIIFEKLNTK